MLKQEEEGEPREEQEGNHQEVEEEQDTETMSSPILPASFPSSSSQPLAPPPPPLLLSPLGGSSRSSPDPSTTMESVADHNDDDLDPHPIRTRQQSSSMTEDDLPSHDDGTTTGSSRGRQGLLFYYVARGQVQDVQNLLEDDAEAVDFTAQDNMGFTPLLLAVDAGDLTMTVTLLKGQFPGSPKGSWTSIIDLARMAVKKDLKTLVEGLLDSGLLPIDAIVDPGSRATALIYAAKKGKVRIVECLCGRGANLAAVDSEKYTALHHAAERKYRRLCKFLIKSGAPLHIKNSHNERPVGLLSRVISHEAFNQSLLAAYGSMVALGFEFLLSSNDAQKVASLHNDLMYFTRTVFLRGHHHHQCHQTTYSEGTMLGTPYGESTDEEEDEEVDGGGEPLCVVSPTAKVKRRLSSHFTGSVSRRTRPRRVLKQKGHPPGLEYVKASPDHVMKHLGGHDFLVVTDESGAQHQSHGEVMEKMAFYAQFPFDNVFATDASSQDVFEEAMLEENYGPADLFFISSWLTPKEIHNLLILYWRSKDVIAILGIFLICFLSLLVGVLTAASWCVWAGLRATVAVLRSMALSGAYYTARLMGRIRTPPLAPRVISLSASGTDLSQQVKLKPILVRSHSSMDMASDRFAPGVWWSTAVNVFAGLWEGSTSRLRERRSHVHVKLVDIINAAKAYPDGLLAVLVDYDVDSAIFGTDAVRAIVDLKWRTFARGVLKVEFTLHIITLALFSCLAALLHNPNNMVFWHFDVPQTSQDSSHESMFPGRAQSLQIGNAINFLLLVMTARVFCYECMAFSNAGNILQWASSVWNWIDVLSVIFYAITVLCNDFKWVSRMSAFLGLVLWWKTLYFAKSVRPFASLVQMCVATLKQIKYFIVLLALAMMGFGTAFYLLFRSDAAAASINSNVWTEFAHPMSIYINMVAILFGNIDTEDFTTGSEKVASLVVFSFFMLLCPIVMLNLLIAIVAGVHATTTHKDEYEFIKAKAQIITEVEMSFFIDAEDFSWFPEQVYFIHPGDSEDKEKNDNWAVSHGSSTYGGGSSRVIADEKDRELDELREQVKELSESLRHQNKDMLEALHALRADLHGKKMGEGLDRLQTRK